MCNVMSDWRYNSLMTLPRSSVATWTCSLPFSALSIFLLCRLAGDIEIKGNLHQGNLTRIDRTPQVFFARRTAYVVSYEEAWGDVSGFNILHAARAIHLFNASRLAGDRGIRSIRRRGPGTAKEVMSYG